MVERPKLPKLSLVPKLETLPRQAMDLPTGSTVPLSGLQLRWFAGPKSAVPGFKQHHLECD